MDGFAIQLALRDPAVTPDTRARALHGAGGGTPGTGGSALMRSDLFNEPLRRRELLQGGAGLALALGLAGCGVGDEATGRREEGAPAKVVKAEPDGDLVYFNWSEYLDPKLIKDVREAVRRQGPRVQLRLDAGHDGQAALGQPLRRHLPDRGVGRPPAQGQPAAAHRQGAAQERRRRSTTTSPSPGTTRAPTTRCPTRSTPRGIIYRKDKVELTGSWNDLGLDDGARAASTCSTTTRR